MKISKVTKDYFNKSEILFPQLKNIKKSCFQPHKTDKQLIKYECEDCEQEIRYQRCDFYEATHSKRFKRDLKDIKTNQIIKKIHFVPKNAIRYCYQYKKLEEIAHAQFKEHNKNKKNKICGECGHKETCPFKNNVLPFIFTQSINFKDSTEEELKMEIVPAPTIYDENEAMIGSYYQKYFSKPEKEKIIESKDIYTSFRDKQFEYFKKIEKKAEKIKKFPKNYIDISNLHLNFIIKYCLHTKKLSKTILTYILSKLYLNDKTKFINKEKFINWIEKNHYPKDAEKSAWEEGLEILKDLKILYKDKKGNYTHNTQISYNIKTIQKLKQDLPHIFNGAVKMSDGLHWIRIDLQTIFAYMRDKKVKFEHIIYEYLLFLKSPISRKDIEEHWSLTERQQRRIEKDLNIRKTWNNFSPELPSTATKSSKKKDSQTSNTFVVNDYLIDKIFVCDKKKTFKKLKQIKKINKIIAAEDDISVLKNSIIGV